MGTITNREKFLSQFTTEEQNKRILVVDDIASMRQLIREILIDLGFKHITQAGSGQEALDILKLDEEVFDLVISDWNMPGLTGTEFLKAVRGSQRYGSIPFLMVTAEAERSVVMGAIQAGVTNYVVKPVSAETIHQKLKSIFSKK